MEELDQLLDESDLAVFDEDQREVLVKLHDGMKQEIENARNSIETKDEVDFEEVDAGERTFYVEDKKRLDRATNIWKNNGKLPNGKSILTMSEFMELDKKFNGENRAALEAMDNFSTDHPLLIPRVISEVVKEAIEPNIVLTPLLQRINYSHGTQLTFPAVGAITAADIAEGGEYPERSLDFAGQVVAIIGKSGVAVKMTEEMIRYSLYDVMSMHLRAAGRALIRHKEQKVSDQIISNAGGSNVLLDNTAATAKSSTGRNATGGFNGTLSLHDIFTMYATMVNRGFIPNALLMNAFGWEIFADEGLQRIFGFNNGAAMWGQMQGAPGNASEWGNGGFGNGLLQNTTVTAPKNVATSFTNVPSIFPYPFRIIVSPYMPHYASSDTTDMILCDTSELGVLVVDEEVMTESWDDPARDIRKVKLRERYGIGSMNEGKGSGQVNGISLAQSFDFKTNISVQYNTGDLTNPLHTDPTYSGAITSNTP